MSYFHWSKSRSMVTKSTFWPWNPIYLMNHVGWHEVDQALASWKLRKSRVKRQPLHGTVTNFSARLYGQRDGILRGQGILLISALASMVLLLSFFWVPKPKQILTDCIFLKTRKNHFYSEYILEKIMLILSTRIITFCVFSTLPSSSLFFPSHSHLLTKLN